MKARSKWNALAATAGVAGLIAAAALVPGAQAAAVHHCGNKTETLEIASGEVGAKPEIIKTTIKNIVAQGLTCAAADKFLSALSKDHTNTPPQHFKCAIGHFKVPVGYVPQVCTHKGMKVQYAGQGG
jgi:hypothetical protein